MLIQKIKLLVIVLFFFSTSCVKTDKDYKYIELEYFFKAADKSNMLLSPGAKYISYVSLYNNRPNIFIEDLITREVTQLSYDTLVGITRYLWLNDSSIIYMHDEDGKENFHLYHQNIRTKVSRDLTPYPNVKLQILPINSENNSEIYIKLNKRDAKVFDLYKLNVENASLTLVEKNTGEFSYWREDRSGNIKLAVVTDGVNEKFLYKSNLNKNYEEFLSVNFTESFEPLSFTDDGKNIYALSNINRDKTALVVFDLMNKKEKSTIYERKDVEIYDVVFSKRSNKPLYAAYQTSKYEIQSLSKTIDSLQKLIATQLKNTSYKIINFNHDEDKFLIKTISDKNYGTYYLASIHDATLIKLSDDKNKYDSNLFCDVKPIKFNARDNLELNGYLTLPKIKAKNYPLVVIANSSPWTRVMWEYNQDVQFLANRGYAVLQVNQRGSSGYGKEFKKLGFKQITHKMQDDIADGVYYLIKQGIVDTTRIAIAGFSFGGTFALNGLLRDSGLYKCAVSYSGHVNLFTYLKGVPPYYSQYLSMIYEMIGNPEKDNELFREGSVVFHADKIKVPVFIAQGENDTRVSSVEVSTFVKDLKKQNTPVNYLLIKDEGHYFKKLENKITLYSEVESFLEQNLKNINGK